jgi:hypothetical protein
MDGIPTQPVLARSDLAAEACRFLVGRLKPVPGPQGRVHSRPFVGRIDELALYNRPLSALEVRRHYELANPGGHAVPIMNHSSALHSTSNGARLSIPK